MKTLLFLLLLIPSLSWGLTFKDGKQVDDSSSSTSSTNNSSQSVNENEKYFSNNYTFKQWQKVRWIEDTGNLKQTYEIVGNNPNKSYAHAWTNDLVRDGDVAIRLELRDNECGRDDCKVGDYKGWKGRTEFGFWETELNGENWFRWSIYIPEDTYYIHDGWTLLTQFKGNFKSQKNKDCPIIPFYINMDNDGLGIGTEPGDCSETWSPIISNEEGFKGKWLDIVAHTNWSAKDNGFIHIWINGEKKWSKVGANVKYVNKKYPPVLRLPVYAGGRPKNLKQTQVAYFDAFYSAKTCAKMNMESLGYDCKNFK